MGGIDERTHVLGPFNPFLEELNFHAAGLCRTLVTDVGDEILDGGLSQRSLCSSACILISNVLNAAFRNCSHRGMLKVTLLIQRYGKKI
ncbi:hypothetical protein RRF57_000524 [Xylaria bambusicola]|uniref:Uncharacterized protein n=1 Tax=Xylaria bambusicola TaxID=326684 RepID=A0AAN7UAB3_9PEZI